MKRIMEGRTFYEDARGALVPEDMVKPIDQLRDQLVTRIMGELATLQHIMQATKAGIVEDIEAFMELAASEYHVELGGKKGNLQLTSFDGKHRVSLRMNDRQTFTEGIILGKSLIDKCIEKWSSGANANLKTIIDQAFQLNQSGKMDIRRILGLRKLNIDDPDWRKAMDIISDAVQVETSKQYLLAHEKNGDGEYKLKNLNLSDL